MNPVNRGADGRRLIAMGAHNVGIRRTREGASPRSAERRGRAICCRASLSREASALLLIVGLVVLPALSAAWTGGEAPARLADSAAFPVAGPAALLPEKIVASPLPPAERTALQATSRVRALSRAECIPPAPPDVKPLIAEAYSNDSDADRVDDGLMKRVEAARRSLAAATAPKDKTDARAALDARIDVELVFREPVTLKQINDFLNLGGEITWIYGAVSHGWNGRVPLDSVDALPIAMGSALVLVNSLRPTELHMKIATQTGRARPVWASGFAGSGSGYDGSSTIRIAILDTGVDDSHTDLAGRSAYWADYSGGGATTPVDYIGHGTHVAGIATGTGAALGTGTTLRFSQGNSYSGVPSGSFYPSVFDVPSASLTWTLYGVWNGGGTTTLYAGYTPKGTSSYAAITGATISSGQGFSHTFTPSSANAYTPLLLSNGTMQQTVCLNQVTNYSAVGDGFNTLRGVAPGCEWVGAKVFTNAGSGDTGMFNAALDAMVTLRSTHNIKILNMSLGVIGTPGLDATLRQKVNTAANNGILPVISAGNDGPSSAAAGEIDDPGRAAMALTVGATNDINQLTAYTSHGFASPGSTPGQEEDYKPDVLAPGGSDYYSNIMSVETNDADVSYYTDIWPNDYYNIKGTSMASPFAAGCAALVIDALQSTSNLTGGSSWSFANSADARRVKMLLCATATETNADREAGTGTNPTLQRNAAGPSGFPVGKDPYEGYGLLNVDAAIEGGTVNYSIGSVATETLGGSDFARRAWARTVTLTAGAIFYPMLTVPAGGDFDLYLYSYTPTAYGIPTLLASSAKTGLGTAEALAYVPSSTQTALLVVKRISGQGTFSLNAPDPLVDADGDGSLNGAELLVPSPAASLIYPLPGDGNGDNLLDFVQTRVASLPNAKTPARYVTVVSNVGALQNVSSVLQVNGLPNDPSQFPAGLVSCTIAGLASGGSAIVDLYYQDALPSGMNHRYYKYGLLPSSAGVPYLYRFADPSPAPRAEILSSTHFRLYLTDGMKGDGDVTANGVIVDPGGPGPLGDPLLVDLESFEAIALGEGAPVQLRWTTSAEYDNAGFNVYRAEAAGPSLHSKAERLTQTLIPAAGSETEGADYELLDEVPLQSGETRWYYLEDVDFQGTARLHGPVSTRDTLSGPAGVRDWMLFIR